MTDERDCEHCKHYKDMLIGIGIDEHTVKCCELWDCEMAKRYVYLMSLNDKEAGCEGCKHDNKASTEYPCNVCKNNHPNMFEWRGKE